MLAQQVAFAAGFDCLRLTHLQQQLPLRYGPVRRRRHLAVAASIAALALAIGQLVLQRHCRRGSKEDGLVMGGEVSPTVGPT